MQQGKTLLKPIRASEWFTFNTSFQHILKNNGAVPTNDIFLDLWHDNAKIKLLRGGRGGGKSESICDILINKCLTQAYFKCFYGRKVFENVRNSCFDTLVTSIRKNKVEHLFHFSTANTSSMIITCLLNGNVFIPFGSDKPDKLKSIKDPTHIWCEEFDQFEFEDFKELYPTLRTIRGENEFWGSFNSYAVYETHWILKYFYPELYKGDDKSQWDVLEGVSITDISVNFYDNLFIDQPAYEQSLRIASGGNSLIFEGLANGGWGVAENLNPWLYTFDINKHIKPDIKFLPTHDVYLSFDFNREPVTCTATQMSLSRGMPDSFVHTIFEFAEDVQLKDLCQRIKAKFPASILFVTGDRTGKKGDIGFEQRHATYYTMIQSYLNLADKQMNVEGKNLEHNDSRLLVNTVLHNHPNVFISQKGCPKLCNECQIAEVDEKSAKPGMLKKDRLRFKMDLFDNYRYMWQTYFSNYAETIYQKMPHLRK